MDGRRSRWEGAGSREGESGGESVVVPGGEGGRGKTV